MIYSDREIQLSIERGTLGITPPPSPEAYASTAVDLRLDFLLHVWNPIAADEAMGLHPCFCPAADGFNVNQIIKDHTRTFNLNTGPFRLYPHHIQPPKQQQGSSGRGFILGWTKEKLRIPSGSRVCARVEGKSSMARLGLGVHVTAPTIHAGFGDGKDPEGDSLQLEIWNVGPLPIELRHEMRICQLIFEEVHGTPVKGYRGQFLGQGPKPN